MSTASFQPHARPAGEDESKAAPRAVVRLLRSARAGQVPGQVSEAQLERIRALHPELVAQLEAAAPRS